MLYRISGFTSLNQLFPNLAVIRGRELFKDFALIIYEMLELTEIGLSRLMEIERGNVRIEKNEKMCFVDTINWPKITTMSSGPYLEVSLSPSTFIFLH
jgi:Receptor L domain